MSTWNAFGRTILEKPDDRVRHQVFADWLEEMGHPLAKWVRESVPHEGSTIPVGRAARDQASFKSGFTWEDSYRRVQDPTRFGLRRPRPGPGFNRPFTPQLALYRISGTTRWPRSRLAYFLWGDPEQPSMMSTHQRQPGITFISPAVRNPEMEKILRGHVDFGHDPEDIEDLVHYLHTGQERQRTPR